MTLPGALVPAVVVTYSPQVPRAPAPVTAVISVVESVVTSVASMAPSAAPKPCPTRTFAPAWNPVPIIVISVPPVVGPEFGVTEVIVGLAADVYLNMTPLGALVPAVVVTYSPQVPGLAPPPV